MRPPGSGGVPASAALPLLDKGPPCRRRGAWHLPARRSERDPCYYSDRLLGPKGADGFVNGNMFWPERHGHRHAPPIFSVLRMRPQTSNEFLEHLAKRPGVSRGDGVGVIVEVGEGPTSVVNLFGQDVRPPLELTP